MKNIILLFFIFSIGLGQFKFQRCLPDRYYSIYISGEDGVARNTAVNGTPITANGIYKADTAKFGNKALGINGEVSTQFYANYEPFYNPLVYGKDWTIEMWAFPTVNTYANNGYYRFLWGNGYSTNYQPTSATYNVFNKNEVRFLNSTCDAWVIIFSTPDNSMPLNTWTHIAQCRKSDTVYLFINGRLISKIYTTVNFGDGTNYKLYFGGLPQLAPNSTNGFIGFMQHIRFSKGVARYTQNFTINKP